MAAIETGSNTAWVANVNSTYSLETTLKDASWNTLAPKHRENIDLNTQGSMLVSAKNDDTAVMLRADRKWNLLSGNYNPEIIDAFEWATVNVQKWTATSTTFVPAQSTTGGYNMNNTNLTTANAVSVLQTQRLFYKIPRVPLQAKFRVRANINTNSNADFGFGVPTTTTLIVPNGVAVRVINGLWSIVCTFNNVETVTANINKLSDWLQFATNNTNAEFYVVDIIADDDNIIATIQNTQTGDIIAKWGIEVPLSSLAMWWATALPFYARVWNAAVAPSIAPVVTLGYTQILTTDMVYNGSITAGNLGMTAGRNPFTGAQLENHTNSTAPTSATLSNTAAWYATLGGRFQFAATAGAATDYALFGFTVPAGSKFICEGIHIELYNTVVAVATTPTIFEWSMWFNSSAVSLATANIIRRQVGCQNFQVGAWVGACATAIETNFITPEVVESGRFVHVILNMPVGTATATEIFRGICLIKWRFI